MSLVVDWSLKTLVAFVIGFRLVHDMERSPYTARIAREDWFAALTIFVVVYSACGNVTTALALTALLLYGFPSSSPKKKKTVRDVVRESAVVASAAVSSATAAIASEVVQPLVPRSDNASVTRSSVE